MAKAIVQNRVDPIYNMNGELDPYVRSVGSKQVFWTKFTPQNNASINQTQRIEVRETVKDYYYRFTNSFMRVKGKMVNIEGNANLAATQFHKLNTDCFASEVELKLSNGFISHPRRQQNVHKLAHISSIFNYDKDYVDKIRHREFFYPDTGKDASLHRAPFKSISNVRSIEGAVGAAMVAAHKYIRVGDAAGGIQEDGAALDVLESVNKNGNPYFFIQKNELYNEGFYESEVRTHGSKTVIFDVPLHKYVKGIPAIEGLHTATNFDLRVTLCDRNEMITRGFILGDGAGGDAAEADAKFLIEEVILFIETYEPDLARLEFLQTLYFQLETPVVRKYIDYKIIQSQKLTTNTSFNYDILNIIDHKPVHIMFGIQLARDFMTQLGGNPHRYINPRFTRLVMKLGNNQDYPRNAIVPLTGNDEKDDYELYQQTLSALDADHPLSKGNLLSFEKFRDHFFVFAFDLRNIDLTSINFNIPHSIRLEATMSGLTNDAVNNNWERNGVIPKNGVNISIDEGYYIWTFIGEEKTIEIKPTKNGLTIRNDVQDLE